MVQQMLDVSAIKREHSLLETIEHNWNSALPQQSVICNQCHEIKELVEKMRLLNIP